ncbi:MAG: 50S ribosomal protein L23 [Bacteroidetes bacterium CG2_30_33_31]|nr:MAG: 50S ribosomal protein L23 [Bacteroidetes bacterium CG2_30_33_31]
MNIIERPIISEKLSALTEKLNRYGFVVKKNANKIQIKQAIESLYEVEVAAVNTMNYGGKAKSRSTKSGYIPGRTQAFKKAIVTLAEGQSIDFYSNI